MSKPGKCPLCSAAMGNTRPVGGIWTGSRGSKAKNGPLYEGHCTKCDEKFIAMPTTEEAEAGIFIWELSTEFPGERFVATMVPDGDMQEFLKEIDALLQHLKANGFAARCPAYTFAGVLVPKTQAVTAREYLSTAHFDRLRIWISDDDGREQTYIGKL